MQEITIPNLQTVQERVLVAEAFKFTAWHIHFRATHFTLNKCSKPQTGSSWHILASGNSGFIWTTSGERYSRRDGGNDLLNCVKNEFVWSYCRLLGKYPDFVLIPSVRPSANLKSDFKFSGTYLNSPSSILSFILVQQCTSSFNVSVETESYSYQYCPF